MKRRTFLSVIMAFLCSTGLVSFAYPLFRFLAPSGAGEKAQKITIKNDEIPSGEAKDIILNNTPVTIINRPGKGFIALSRVCTHLGCLVEYNRTKNDLICPCHAGAYDLEGNVVSGPPPKPLQKFPIQVEGENIVIG